MHFKQLTQIKYIWFGTIILSVFVINGFADVMVEINNVKPDKIEMAGFTLPNDQSVSIEVYGLQPYRHRHSRPYTYGWILNADSRQVVWEVRDGNIDRERRYEYSCTDKIDLKKGTYEVYYAAFPYLDEWGWDWDDDHHAFGNVVGHIFDAIFGPRDSDYNNYDYEKLFIRVEGNGTGMDEKAVLDEQDALKKKALLSFTPMGRDRVSQTLLKVSEPTDIHIYAIGEARRDGDFDFGWITNMQTRKRVWELTYRDSEHAGGASKNRQSVEDITLQPGTYKVSYITDDTHHYRNWNSYPPFDPEFWGLTIWLENPQQASSITMQDPSDYEDKAHAIIDFTRIRDNDYRAEGFTLNKDLDVHILAIGEGRDGEMFDYGWIVNTGTREKVWKMKFHDTEPAGGAAKNRMFDGIIHLNAGNYMAYYITDDSHAYRSWNESPPFDEKDYGMTISVMDDKYKEGDVSEYSETKDKSILARIVRVGDDIHERKEFTLDKDGPVHVYAIGEGEHGEMFDYAYIESANSGQVVWEMTYRKTERAGGAHKNRLFDDDVYLQAGKYYVIYESDDSHSFKEWNSTPPDDPVNWGVTISYSK